MGRLDSKVVIITGASGGQGTVEARLFAAEGARLVLTDIVPGGEKIAEELGEKAIFLKHDISDEAAWDEVIKAGLSAFGAINVLVNNAAMYRAASLENTELALFERLIRINQVGTFLGMRAVIAPMVADLSFYQAIPGLLDALPDAVIVIDGQGGLQWANRTAERTRSRRHRLRRIA